MRKKRELAKFTGSKEDLPYRTPGCHRDIGFDSSKTNNLTCRFIKPPINVEEFSVYIKLLNSLVCINPKLIPDGH